VPVARCDTEQPNGCPAIINGLTKICACGRTGTSWSLLGVSWTPPGSLGCVGQGGPRSKAGWRPDGNGGPSLSVRLFSLGCRGFGSI